MPALQDSDFVAQLVDQLLSYFSRRTFNRLRLLGLLRNVEALNFLQVPAYRGLHFRHGHFAQWLVLGLLDAVQGRVAQLVDAGLDGQHSWKGHIHKLEVACFQLALYTNAGIALLNLHDDGRMWPAQQLGQNYTGLGVAVVVRLETGENQVRSEEHTSELQSRGHLVCRLLLEKKK